MCVRELRPVFGSEKEPSSSLLQEPHTCILISLSTSHLVRKFHCFLAIHCKYTYTIRVHQILEIMLDLPFQKVHTFQKSLDAVLQRLGESEMGQNTLSNTACTLQPGQTAASLENEILLFRNQLKIQSANLVSVIWP